MSTWLDANKVLSWQASPVESIPEMLAIKRTRRVVFGKLFEWRLDFQMAKNRLAMASAMAPASCGSGQVI